MKSEKNNILVIFVKKGLPFLCKLCYTVSEVKGFGGRHFE